MSLVFFCTASGLQFPHFLQTANRKVKQLSQGLAPVFGLQSGQKHAQKHLCVRAPPFSIMLSNWRLCWEGLTAAVLLRTHVPPSHEARTASAATLQSVLVGSLFFECAATVQTGGKIRLNSYNWTGLFVALKCWS